MKTIVCEKCENAVKVINGLNCRVKSIRREKAFEDHIAIICELGVYCAECGKETTFTIKHYFSKEFCFIPNKYLAQIVLGEQGIFGGSYGK